MASAMFAACEVEPEAFALIARAAEGSYVWQKLLHTGARLAAGSDFPVERPDPLLGFYAAVTRQSEGGSVVGQDETVSRPEALRMMTSAAARFSFDEKSRGSIEAGKLAVECFDAGFLGCNGGQGVLDDRELGVLAERNTQLLELCNGEPTVFGQDSGVRFLEIVSDLSYC